jgi:hypothetical protein
MHGAFPDIQNSLKQQASEILDLSKVQLKATSLCVRIELALNWSGLNWL